MQFKNIRERGNLMFGLGFEVGNFMNLVEFDIGERCFRFANIRSWAGSIPRLLVE